MRKIKIGGDKRAALDLTVGMLITIVLSVILISMIVYGVVSGDIIPLAKKLGAMADDALIALHLRSAASSGSTYQEVDIPGIGKGLLTMTENDCKVDITKGLDGSPSTLGSYSVNLGSGNLEKYFDVISIKNSEMEQEYFYYNDLSNQWYWAMQDMAWKPVTQGEEGAVIRVGYKDPTIFNNALIGKNKQDGEKIIQEDGKTVFGTFINVDSYVSSSASEFKKDIYDSFKSFMNQQIDYPGTLKWDDTIGFVLTTDSGEVYAFGRGYNLVEPTDFSSNNFVYLWRWFNGEIVGHGTIDGTTYVKTLDSSGILHAPGTILITIPRKYPLYIDGKIIMETYEDKDMGFGWQQLKKEDVEGTGELALANPDLVQIWADVHSAFKTLFDTKIGDSPIGYIRAKIGGGSRGLLYVPLGNNNYYGFDPTTNNFYWSSDLVGTWSIITKDVSQTNIDATKIKDFLVKKCR